MSAFDETEAQPHLCAGCNVRGSFEHRCWRDDGAWMGEPPCECPECLRFDEALGRRRGR